MTIPVSNLATVTDEGDLKISYLAGPTALRAHADRSRIKVFWGPVRSGKSSAACWRGMQRARVASTIYNTSLRGLVIRDTYTNLRDSTLKTWLEWFPDKSACGYFHKSTQTYHLRTPDDREHEIMFRHGKDADDASNFLSTEFGWVLLEEVVPAYTKTGLVSPGISEDMLDAVIIRLAQRGILRPELDITCNPPTPQHWVNRRILARKPEELAADGIAHFFFPGKENEMNLRPGYYDELRRLLKGQHTTIARFVDGEIVAIYPGVAVYQKDFSTKTNVSDRLKFDPSRPIISFWDNPPTPACLIAQVDQRGRLLILKELQGGFIDGRIMEAIGQREFAKLVKAELAENFRGYKLGRGWADPSLKSPSNTETTTPLQILHAEGFTDIGFGAVDNDSRQESVHSLLGTNLSGEAALQISRSGCPLLIEGMAGGYVFGTGTDGKRLAGNGPVKNEFSHLCNALEYGVSGLYPPIRPNFYKPQRERRPPSAMSA